MTTLPRHRSRLPQLRGIPMLTDGGLETTLIYHEGLELPLFASFTQLESAAGRAALIRYFESYVDVARKHGTGIVLESATWRASPDWGAKLGYTPERLAELNAEAIDLLVGIRDDAGDVSPVVISGNIGPQDDGYSPAATLSADEAEAYHGVQIRTFAATAADMVSAITMTYADEAIGVTRAARAAGMPVAISFTVETDGRLPSGQSLGDAIAQVDREAAGGPDYYMINCAHPTHFAHTLAVDEPWLDRILGLRANASAKSHAELDESTELDEGDPVELAAQYAQLQRSVAGVTVLGGCCGTDERHVDAIAGAWLAAGKIVR
jgi:homocysteine S-methyltransferase